MKVNKNLRLDNGGDLGIALKEPAYVIAKDPCLNTVTIGGEERLATNTVVAKDTNWLIDESEALDSVHCEDSVQHNTQPQEELEKWVRDRSTI